LSRLLDLLEPELGRLTPPHQVEPELQPSMGKLHRKRMAIRADFFIGSFSKISPKLIEKRIAPDPISYTIENRKIAGSVTSNRGILMFVRWLTRNVLFKKRDQQVPG